MATIYSNRNDGASSHTTVLPSSTSTWAGGIVPGAADTVYVVGRRTQINQAAFAKWTGTRTITVDSTANYASTGFFYVNTNGGEIAKINYTGITSTTFTGCSINETDSFYKWDSDQTIPDNAYVHNPAYVIEIPTGQTFECDILIVQEGGWLFVNGGTLKINNYVMVRDGRIVGRGSGTVIISRPAGTTSSSTIGDFISENYPISVIDIDGGEVRTHGTTTAVISKGDVSVAVTGVANGSFAVGDEIAIYGVDDYRRRNVGYTGYRDASANFKDMDEGFDVCGVNGNTLYLAMRNGATGTVKFVDTVSTQKVLEVVPDDVYFTAGDKIVINNVGYTIDKAEDSEFLLYHYDFTNPATSLSDFWVDDATHAYSGQWQIESGVGLRNTSTSYRELIHKSLWTREVIIEAEMSPLSGYSTGTRGTAAFGLCAAYDPAFRFGHRGYDSFKTDYLTIDDSGQDFLYYIRSMSNYPNNRPDRVTSVLNATRTAASYKVVSRKAKTTVYFNGDVFTEEFRRDGHYKGLVGLYANGNTNFRCRRLTIKAATQKIYITTSNSIAADSKVYQSGADHQHPVGSKVVKIASINTGNGSHVDLAFAYRGQRGNAEWPQIIQVNGSNTNNASLPYCHNHDMNVDYYYNLGETTSPVSMTIDLGSQKTFTHVSFVPRLSDTGGYYGYNGVAVYGSNDLSTWTTLYGPTNDTKKWYGGGGSYNRMAFYPTGNASYRYVKFETRGDQGGSARNRYTNIGVHNFTEGYTVSLNNASDFNIGDKITVSTDCGFSWSSRELEAYRARIEANTDPETYFHGGWLNECTITNKVGNKLYLDKPIFWGYIEDEDSCKVVKISRNFTITGVIGTDNVFANSWRWPNITMLAGSSLARKYLFKNTLMQYIGSYRYSGSTSFNRGFRNYSYDYWNATLLDGVVHKMGPDGTTWVGVGNYTAHAIFRNSVVMGMYTGYWNYYSVSYTGTAYFNNKIFGTILGLYSDGAKAFAFNYNEIATTDSALSLFTARVDRLVIPYPNELRFNTMKGSSNSGIRLNSESVGPRRAPRLWIEQNKVRGMDDYSVAGQTFDGWPYIGSNFMSDHTGSRLSRYRNEGHMTEGDTSSDLSMCHYQQNYGRFGYDLIRGVYHWYERSPERPDSIRIYNPNADAHLWVLGIELDVLDDVPFQVQVKFDYRVPLMANLQDDGTDDGRLRVYNLQHGTLKSTQYGLVPNVSGTGWNTFSGTFSNFAAENGKAGVFLNRSSQNGYVDIRNASATVLTDHPSKIKVIGNTFNLMRIFDQHHEYKDLAPLTSPARTINVNRIRF
jgi:hypothetical protein